MDRMSGAQRSPVVLVVDDHEDTRQMSLIVLRSQGFSAMAAVGGEAGFVCASEQQPDVIVTDLAMPDGDGWEFVQRLATDARTKHIPVVMLTACATETVKTARPARRRGGVFLQALFAGRAGGRAAAASRGPRGLALASGVAAPSSPSFDLELFLLDLDAFALDVEPQPAEQAHVDVRDPHEREPRDDRAAPIRQQQAIARGSDTAPAAT